MRRAITDFDMIKDADCIAVGVSGGKDSLTLLAGLSEIRRFLGISFNIKAITLDPQFEKMPAGFTAVDDMCRRLGIEYKVILSDIAEIIFEIRKEKNPCSLCAKMRRGALHDAALELGCNKIALGHNYNDAVETFIMNLFNEGRIGCFSPVSYLSRKNLHLIRPLIYAPEHEIRACAVKNRFPVVKSKCPVDGHTNRQKTKEFLANLEYGHRGINQRIFGAMSKAIWFQNDTQKRDS